VAAIRKRGKSWRVQIRRRGHPPQFKAFDTRADAEAWARQIASEMDRGMFVSRVEAERTLVADLLDRYEKEITPGKRSSRAEICRLKMLKDALGHGTGSSPDCAGRTLGDSHQPPLHQL
jgi:hypothetical protein